VSSSYPVQQGPLKHLHVLCCAVLFVSNMHVVQCVLHSAIWWLTFCMQCCRTAMPLCMLVRLPVLICVFIVRHHSVVAVSLPQQWSGFVASSCGSGAFQFLGHDRCPAIGIWMSFKLMASVWQIIGSAGRAYASSSWTLLTLESVVFAKL
jgi:hypothetical protein